MATFICMHGAGGLGAHWDLVAAPLRSHGHEVVAVDVPCDQEVGLDAYVRAVLDAIGDRQDDLVLVAQSLSGLIAPLVAALDCWNSNRPGVAASRSARPG